MAAHTFNTELAKKIGIIPAIIYAYLGYWCEQNRQNGINEKDGEFWTYHSVRELSDTFDYLTSWQIRNGLDILIKENLVKVARYNKIGIDRTRWFSVVDYDLWSTTNALRNTTNGLCSTTNGLRNTTNAIAEYHKPIPIISTVTSNNYIKGNSSRTFCPPSVDEVRAYCLERGNSVDPEQFVDFYTSKGWKVGKDKMKDWKACVRTWEKRKDNRPAAKKKDTNPYRELLKQKGLFDDPTGSDFPFK
jgi:hypothetical protein